MTIIDNLSQTKNSAQHGTIYLLHNLPHQTEQTNKQQREKGKGKRLAIATITSTVACVSNVSHHLYLELYEFSTIHATKMSKDIFFLYLAAPGTGHEQQHRCL